MSADVERAGPELVIGLVGAIGTDLKWVSEVLEKYLATVAYSSSVIRVSHLIHSMRDYSDLASIRDREDYFERHMTAGNDLCTRIGRADAMAALAIIKIQTLRAEENANLGREVETPLSRHVFIVNSLKRSEEIRLLRKVYGDAFVLLGAYASREQRVANLASTVAASQNKESSQCVHTAERLMHRDEAEARESLDPGKFGQDIGQTFFRADAFIDTTDKTDAKDAIRRFVDVLFEHPYETPSRDEAGMQFAYSAALRSADLSRQVGAAICTEDGQLLAVGTNEVPKAGGGFYWPGDIDQRDFRFSERDEPNAEMKRVILLDLMSRLKELGWLASDWSPDKTSAEELASGLKGTRFMDITEYGRAVHAEMAAITDAARRGVSIQGNMLFCTTFPCHNCAKHIVAAGISRVIYIEPYPKSQVARLFSDSISLGGRSDRSKVVFSSFVGFAPTRFSDFFSMRDRVDGEKHILSWDAIKRNARPRVFESYVSYHTEEIRVTEEFTEQLSSSGIEFEKAGHA
jgi:cytidine deaminase